MKKLQSSHNKAFTLIEMLVVIGIIAILASVVLGFLGPAREQARDAKRVEEIRQLQTALELYYRKYGHYPVSEDCISSDPRPNRYFCNSIQGLTTQGHWIKHNDPDNSLDDDNALAEFIAQDPIDPLHETVGDIDELWLWYSGSQTHPKTGTYYYFSSGYGGSGQWYMLMFTLENGENHPIKNDVGVTACDGTYFDYSTTDHTFYDSELDDFLNTDESVNFITIGADCKKRI